MLHAGVVFADTGGILRCADKVALEPKTVTVDGVKGTFLPPLSMNRVVFVLSECVPLYEELAASQAVLIAAQATAVKTASAAISAQRTTTTEEHERAEAWKAAYKEEREANSGVLRSPIFWLFTGLVTGIAAAVATTFAVTKALEGRTP